MLAPHSVLHPSLPVLRESHPSYDWKGYTVPRLPGGTHTVRHRAIKDIFVKSHSIPAAMTVADNSGMDGLSTDLARLSASSSGSPGG